MRTKCRRLFQDAAEATPVQRTSEKFASREAVERIRTHAPPTKTDASSRLSVHYMTIDGVAQSG